MTHENTQRMILNARGGDRGAAHIVLRNATREENFGLAQEMLDLLKSSQNVDPKRNDNEPSPELGQNESGFMRYRYVGDNTIQIRGNVRHTLERGDFIEWDGILTVRIPWCNDIFYSGAIRTCMANGSFIPDDRSPDPRIPV